MRNSISALIFPSLLLLVACGGGGGGDDSPAVAVSDGATNNNTTPEYTEPVVAETDEVAENENPNEVPVETTPVEVLPIETTPADPVDEEQTEFASTALLEVPSDYDWKMEFSLPIDVSLQENQKAFLSVCTDYSLVDGIYLVNYTSCILRTSVTNYFSGTLNISNDRKKLIAVVWYLDPKVAPRYQEWNAESDIDLPFIMSVI